MTRDQVRRLITANPFEPFTMHLAAGRKVPVRHRDFILLSPDGNTCVVWEEDANAFGVIDLFLVTQLRVERNGEAAAKSGGKGKKGKKG